MRRGHDSARQPQCRHTRKRAGGEGIPKAAAADRLSRGIVPARTAARERSSATFHRSRSPRRRRRAYRRSPSAISRGTGSMKGIRKSHRSIWHDDIRTAYQKASTVLRLPMAGGFSGLETITRNIPFIARQSRRDADEVRRAIGLRPRQDGKPLVLMSFGGYGIDGLDTSALGELKEYTIATTDLPARDHQHPACARARLYFGTAALRERSSLRRSGARRRCRRDQAGLRDHQRGDRQRHRSSLHLARTLRRIRRARERDAPLPSRAVHRTGGSAERKLGARAGNAVEPAVTA